MSIHTVYTQLKNDDLVIYKSFNLLVDKLVTVTHSKTLVAFMALSNYLISSQNVKVGY